MARTDPRLAMLARILEQAFDKKSWHGTTLRGALRGVTPEQALWRPARDRHNVWELALHTAYWKYAVRRNLAHDAADDARGGFAREPSNWPRLPEPADRAAWKRDVALLESEHEQLLAAVRALSPKRLDERTKKGTWTLAELIHGVAAHDLYHAGQIQLLKRLR